MGKLCFASFLSSGSIQYENFNDTEVKVSGSLYCSKEQIVDKKFTINRKTGKIEAYHYIDDNYLDTVTGEKKNRDDNFKIAKDFLNKNVNDVDEYVLSEEKFWDVARYGGVYVFTFIRVVDDIKIKDSAQINISAYGDIITYIFNNLGEYEKVQIPNDEELAKIQEIIDDKMSQIYSNLKEKYTVSYKTEDIYFVTLADGRDCLEYIIDVTLEPVNGSDHLLGETTGLLVCLN